MQLNNLKVCKCLIGYLKFACKVALNAARMKAIPHPTTILSDSGQKSSTKATHNAAEPFINIKMSNLAPKNVGKVALQAARMKAILHLTTILSDLDQKSSTKASHNAAEPSKKIKMSNLASKNVGKAALQAANIKAMPYPTTILSDSGQKNQHKGHP